MSEQDTSKWKLDQPHSYKDYREGSTTVQIDADDDHGVWFEIEREEHLSVDRSFAGWIPPEVAEAIGTMLLYAAQKHREEFPNVN